MKNIIGSFGRFLMSVIIIVSLVGISGCNEQKTTDKKLAELESRIANIEKSNHLLLVKKDSLEKKLTLASNQNDSLQKIIDSLTGNKKELTNKKAIKEIIAPRDWDKNPMTEKEKLYASQFQTVVDPTISNKVNSWELVISIQETGSGGNTYYTNTIQMQGIDISNNLSYAATAVPDD